MSDWGQPVLYSLYIYQPNNIAPIIFAVLYGISAVLHIWQCIRYKAFKLAGLLPTCAVLFTLGYALREYGAYNYLYRRTDKTALIVYITSQISIYVCPPLLELANYHILARMFSYVPFFAPIPASLVLRTFGGLMAIVEALNALGVALASNPTSSPTTQAVGSHVSIAAISIQLAVIVSFFLVAGLFQYRLGRARLRVRTVQTLLYALYASMALILARCIYRLVEHLGPSHKNIADMDALWALSPLFRYEIFFLVFEAILMLLNSLLWNAWHPARYLPRETHVYLAQDGTEVEGEKEVDGRNLGQKVAHVLSFGLLFRHNVRNYAALELTAREGGASQ
ncbi:uncharacterized protein B0I36DRAFT_387511 [Microdochium trichocladiopsis]|uniref:RTA1 domain protein n=1 Tax=Microdochium trichocladiopsis TaxID=1682393 RepID=A0A9P9BLR1_9PEZI|nr:uncharacterized protein B0I36DRAFT_387511 [Microdochium trichocladiopsis]KAH7025167.1 hypothetical protein B0I36DRAFT_387511 [Microdochium trichocladiopsis]